MNFCQTIALCIPAYNAASYLPKLLKSAQEQLIPFNEILVYNDCSTDDTKQVAEQLGATVINGDINRGCSFGKNTLAQVANSCWLHFHDADDVLLSNFTEVADKWVKLLNAPDVVLLNYEYRDAQTRELINSTAYDLNMMKEDLVKFAITHKLVNFGLYKKESFIAVGGFNLDPKVLYNEDAAFHHRLALNRLSFAFEREITCINYRYHRSMSRGNADKCHLAAYYVTENLIKENLHVKYPSEISLKYWTLARLFASVSNWAYARKSIDKAVEIGRSRIPKHEESNLLKYLCFLHPFFAYLIREHYVRLFKSVYR